MDAEKQRAIASKGGKAAHLKGTAHEFTSEEARIAGSKGGRAARQKSAKRRADLRAVENNEQQAPVSTNVMPTPTTFTPASEERPTPIQEGKSMVDPRTIGPDTVRNNRNEEDPGYQSTGT